MAVQRVLHSENNAPPLLTPAPLLASHIRTAAGTRTAAGAEQGSQSRASAPENSRGLGSCGSKAFESRRAVVNRWRASNSTVKLCATPSITWKLERTDTIMMAERSLYASALLAPQGQGGRERGTAFAMPQRDNVRSSVRLCQILLMTLFVEATAHEPHRWRKSK